MRVIDKATGQSMDGPAEEQVTVTEKSAIQNVEELAEDDLKVTSSVDSMVVGATACIEQPMVAVASAATVDVPDTPSPQLSHTSIPTDGSLSSLSPVSTGDVAAGYELSQNGHLSPTEGITNGTGSEGSSPSPGQGAMPASVQSFQRPSSNHGHSPPAPGSYQASPASRTDSPGEQPTPTGTQHVVHVHVNPGETFTVRVGEQIQVIRGPATVRMVSNNGPPMPMPMQVPPGHMVQQIVDENGILTHVILSPQPTGMPAPPITGGPNGTPQMYNPAYGGGGYSPYPGQYAPHPHPGAPHHVHPVPQAAPIHGTPPPPCPAHSHHHTGPPLSPLQTFHPGDERQQRQKQRLKEKWKQKQAEGYYHNHMPDSPHKSKPKINGDIRASGHESSSSSIEDGMDMQEDSRLLRESLSHMQQPKVSEVESRSALIQLNPPDWDLTDYEVQPTDFRYELLLSEKDRNAKYNTVYNGDATEITLKDLKPASDYHLKVSCMLDDLKGSPTEPVSFRTQCCEPDPPQPAKLSSKTKTSLQLKWSATVDNGAKISSYTLEYDQGRGDMHFVEIFNGLQRQYKVTKLQASTGYTFRLAAINSIGKSEFSDAVLFHTSGSVPSLPDPPMLSEQFVKALTISWIKRPNDDEFTLQMEDEATGHGFLNVYNGPELSYKIKNLRRNTEYRFRLQANNEEGNSKWSDVVCYHTLPDRPSPPLRPQLKGKVHAHVFKLIWDPPKDTGGAEISQYRLELDDGRGFEVIYEGIEREHSCDQLQPGHTYRVRVSCCSKGGRSDLSESVNVTTQAVPPGVCQAPRLQGKPRATSLHLRWNYPDYDGGAQVTDFEVSMTNSDSSQREVYKGRDTDCMVAGLLPGRPYLFQVRCNNKAGAGPWSESLDLVSGPGVPESPKAPIVDCRWPNSAVVSWEEPMNNGATITEYRLEQQRPEGEFTQLYAGSALSYQVRGLSPATSYNFRVQAVNLAGAGPFSTAAWCLTPSSRPDAVVSVRFSATATTIHLMWHRPANNGSDITAFNLDIGEKQTITVTDVTEYVVEDLIPETVYKIRVQAVNGVGVGAFSAPLKVTTRSLPPQPPRVECVSAGPNSLKLKWGDGRNPDLIQYCLEMLRDNGSFHPVYHGTSHTHKVNKLTEMTCCELRLYASNEAGDGPYSPIFSFYTTKAPPPAVKAPRVSDHGLEGALVDWPACKPMASDTIVYVLQLQNLQGRDQEYRQVYRGTETSFRLQHLSMKCEYQVRVCAVRQCVTPAASVEQESDQPQDEETSIISEPAAVIPHTPDLTGAFSPGVTFSTLSPRPAHTTNSSTGITSKATERKPLTDQQWAAIILLIFTLFAIFIAFLAHKIIAYRNSSAVTGSLSSPELQEPGVQ